MQILFATRSSDKTVKFEGDEQTCFSLARWITRAHLVTSLGPPTNASGEPESWDVTCLKAHASDMYGSLQDWVTMRVFVDRDNPNLIYCTGADVERSHLYAVIRQMTGQVRPRVS